MKKQRWGFVPVYTLVFGIVLSALFLCRVMPGSGVIGARAVPSEVPADFSEPMYPININTATAQELALLPGIGPVTAEAIVAHRQARGPFEAIEELTEVAGIGQAKLRQIMPYITTGG